MTESRRALVTGVTGQDGSYLAESLLKRGTEVYGLVRRQARPDYGNIRHLLGEIRLLSGDLADVGSLLDAVSTSRPDEVYNLAAQSDVAVSFEQPSLTAAVNATGAMNVLEAVRRTAPRARVYQAATSELYGACKSSPHTLPGANGCSFQPVSPYAYSKLFAYHAVRTYRARGMFAVNGVLFNHESPRRGEGFVTRRITKAVAMRAAGHGNTLSLGNVDAVRDWGYAPEYVEAMQLMLQQDEPRDTVIGTGVATTVEEFLGHALVAAGLDDEDEGWVSINHPAQLRPVETAPLVAETTDAYCAIGWRAATTAPDLARLMVQADMDEISHLTLAKPRVAVTT